jgi:hypothetical protein
LFRFKAITAVLLIVFHAFLFAQDKQFPENAYAAIQDTLLIRKFGAGVASTDNLLLNGDFSNGDNYWETWINPEAEASGAVDNEEFPSPLRIINGLLSTISCAVFPCLCK